MKRFVTLTILLAGGWAGAERVALVGAGEKGDHDQKFVKMAAASGMAEVKLGEMAYERGSSEAVKKYAKRMVLDHTKANKQLMTICTSKGLTVPKGLDKKHKEVVEKLSKLEGPAFDAAYARAMLKDHMAAVKLFRTESESGTDEALKAFATKTLPVLEMHLKMAKKLPGAAAAGADGKGLR